MREDNVSARARNKFREISRRGAGTPIAMIREMRLRKIPHGEVNRQNDGFLSRAAARERTGKPRFGKLSIIVAEIFLLQTIIRKCIKKGLEERQRREREREREVYGTRNGHFFQLQLDCVRLISLLFRRIVSPALLCCAAQRNAGTKRQ